MSELAAHVWVCVQSSTGAGGNAPSQMKLSCPARCLGMQFSSVEPITSVGETPTLLPPSRGMGRMQRALCKGANGGKGAE